MQPGIIKRDGRGMCFDRRKIWSAVQKAFKEVHPDLGIRALEMACDEVTQEAESQLNKYYYNPDAPYADSAPTVEYIQDTVEQSLMRLNHLSVAKAYILYRKQRTNTRECKSILMDTVGEIVKESNRDNANVGNSPSAKLLQIAEAASKEHYLHRVIPKEQSKLHLDGDVYINDLSWYGKTLTCIQIPLGRLLKNGFDTGKGYIRTPKSIKAAGALSAIIMQSTQNDLHGGISFGYFDRDMSSYVETEFVRQEKKVRRVLSQFTIAEEGEEFERRVQEEVLRKVEDETWQAMEGFIYNLNSMHSRAGAQIPFSSINLGMDTSRGGRMVTKYFLKAYERGLGKGESPIFPNVCFKLKSGVSFDPGDPNYDLFQLAMQVACTRLQPNFSFQDSSFNSIFDGEEVAYMGCRTRVIANVNGDAVTDGRGNLSFTTINLPRIALKTKAMGIENPEESLADFWKRLKETVIQSMEILYHRYLVQRKMLVKDMPFLMGEHLYMDSEGLGPNDPIERPIKNGSLSTGFIGLAECLYALFGANHADNISVREFGLEIIGTMRKLCDDYSEKHKLNFTLLASPAESTAGRLLAIDKKEFGVVEGVTDKAWYTNSFHVPVEYDISAHRKIEIEGPYHKLCNAGHIGYVELPSAPTGNIEAFERILRHMAACDFGYGAVNFPVDQCYECAHNGLIPKDECPKCGCTNISRVRRITGYLSTLDQFNPSKKEEIKHRKTHQ